MADLPEETSGAEHVGADLASTDPQLTPIPGPLPKPVQEHLGRQLRSAYNAVADRPAFLGDTTLPPQFERLIRRIEVSEKLREVGVEAVRQALTGATTDPSKTDRER